MFFKILKKDLRRKKSLNITIFLFIITAAMICAVSSSVLYCTLYGMNNTFSTANTADYNIFQTNSIRDRDKNNDAIAKWSQKTGYIKSFSNESFINFSSKTLEFPGLDIPGNSKFDTATHIVERMPKIHNLVFDTDDRPFFLKHGEIAIPIGIKELTGAKVGDKIHLTTDMGNTYEFTVSHIFKDALFPVGFINYYRYFLSDGDFQQILEQTPVYCNMYSFSCDEKEALISDFSEQEFGDYKQILSIDSLEYSYSVQITATMILFLVSIFLLIIVFVTIRFTITSTIQEDFREIGMMKAVGVSSMQFKGLYVAKYAFMAISGSVIGYIVSLPVSEYFLKGTLKNIIIPFGFVRNLIAFTAVAVIVALIILFCILSMRGMDKMSAIDAIRSGSNGERFEKVSKLLLYKRSGLSVPFYLAISSIINGLRRYVFLICAFILGTALLLMPINVLNSMISPNYLSYWHILPSDFLFDIPKEMHDEYVDSLPVGQPFNDEKFQMWVEKQFEDCCGSDITFGMSKFDTYSYIDHKNYKVSVLALYEGVDTKEFKYSNGVAPVLENEIAISTHMADTYNIKPGSPVMLKIKCYNNEKTAVVNKEKEFFVTGTYQCMLNSGKNITMGNAYKNDISDNFTINRITINAPQEEKAEIIKKLQDRFGKDVVMPVKDFLTVCLGDFVSMFKMMIIFISVIVCIVLFLMTTLYMKLIITREIPGIALLKSLGMNSWQIRLWQISRIIIMLTGSVIIGVVLSTVLGEPLAALGFRALNIGITEFPFVIDKMSVFLYCPATIFTVVFIAALVSCIGIRKINIWNIREE